MASSSNSCVAAMKEEWDRLSKENAFHYIKSLKVNWAEEDFWRSGEHDVATLVDPFLAEIGFSTENKTVLEVGCGVGRMSQALAKRFDHVEAVDISSEMVSRARQYQERAGITNIRYHLVSGQDLRSFDDCSIDFCFSFIVLQHIPDIGVILSYVREMGRVLKPGGALRFQVNGFHHVRMAMGRYLYWGICDTGRLRRLNISSRPCLRFGKLNSWDGVPVRTRELKQVCEDAGLRGVRFAGVGTQYMWVSGKKP